MRAAVVVVPVLTAVAAVAVFVATRSPAPAAHERDAAAARGNELPAGPATGTAAGAHAGPAAGNAAAAPPAGPAAPAACGSNAAAGASMVPRRAWPVSARRGNGRGGGSGQPAGGAVPVRLAFWSLWYLGVDPAAETTWARAINDPRQPAGVRSDLIVDMIDEGYADNDRPGVEDLALIRRRLEILERHAPHAIDDVSSKAFEEAYRTLLPLYLRLGGEARIPVQQR